MARTLVTGATGALGRALQPRLADAGQTVRAASRSPPGEGPADEWVELRLPKSPDGAVEDVDVIVHAATDPRGESKAVDVRGTERLLAAAEAAGVEHFCYVSIVGLDEIPFSYYQHKLAAERAVEASAVPSTIVRITQFQEFVDDLFGAIAKLPVWPLPTRFSIQPIAVAEAADVVVEYASAAPAGRVPDTGGPEVRSVRELATAYRRVRVYRRPIVRLPLPGSTAASFRDGHATCPERAVGTVTWETWLANEYERPHGRRSGSWPPS